MNPQDLPSSSTGSPANEGHPETEIVITVKHKDNPAPPSITPEPQSGTGKPSQGHPSATAFQSAQVPQSSQGKGKKDIRRTYYLPSRNAFMIDDLEIQLTYMLDVDISKSEVVFAMSEILYRDFKAKGKSSLLVEFFKQQGTRKPPRE